MLCLTLTVQLSHQFLRHCFQDPTGLSSSADAQPTASHIFAFAFNCYISSHVSLYILKSIFSVQNNELHFYFHVHMHHYTVLLLNS